MDTEYAQKVLKYTGKTVVQLVLLAAFLALSVGLAIGFGLGGASHHPGHEGVPDENVCDQFDDDCDGPLDGDDTTLWMVPDYSGSMDLGRFKRAVEDWSRLQIEKAPCECAPLPPAPPAPQERIRLWMI